MEEEIKCPNCKSTFDISDYQNKVKKEFYQAVEDTLKSNKKLKKETKKKIEEDVFKWRHKITKKRQKNVLTQDYLEEGVKTEIT